MKRITLPTLTRQFSVSFGVAVYRLQSKLPSELKGKLPTAQQLSQAVRAALPERDGK